MRIGAVLTGVLGLALLEVVTSTPAAASRTAALPVAATGFVSRLLDPNIALLPNWHDSKAPKHTAGTSLTGATDAAGNPLNTIGGVGSAPYGPPVPIGAVPPPTSAAAGFTASTLRAAHGG